MKQRALRRNDIVYSLHDQFWTPLGRVTRIFPNGKVETIDCGRYIRVQPANTLVLVENYRGMIGNDGKVQRMPTLRKLKQRASLYDETVWKRKRLGDYCEQTTFLSSI